MGLYGRPPPATAGLLVCLVNKLPTALPIGKHPSVRQFVRPFDVKIVLAGRRLFSRT